MLTQPFGDMDSSHCVPTCVRPRCCNAPVVRRGYHVQVFAVLWREDAPMETRLGFE